MTEQDIRQALRTLNLPGQVVCLHSSLRSFGHVAEGAIAVVRAFLGEGGYHPRSHVLLGFRSRSAASSAI